jgi:hypothetical protein
VEYYSAIKINDFSSHENTYRKFKYILPSDITQSEKVILIPAT